jgi:hypothetical protein
MEVDWLGGFTIFGRWVCLGRAKNGHVDDGRRERGTEEAGSWGEVRRGGEGGEWREKV